MAPGRRLSALVWGEAPPELVLLHGGAQNAHTWDTVAMALDRPLVAIDLPGHGHSDAPAQGSLGVRSNATDVAAVVGELAPEAEAVVGMSLGGLTTIALADQHPELVRRVVLVDVTPKVEGPGRRRHRRVRQRTRELRRLRRAARPHHRVQPDPLGVVAPPRDPPQRAASATTAAGCGATAASPTPATPMRPARSSGRSPPRTCGTRSAGSRCRSCSCAACGSGRSSTTRPRPSCSAGSHPHASSTWPRPATASRATTRSRWRALLADFVP